MDERDVGRGSRRVVWRGGGNPVTVLSRRLGRTEYEIGAAIHSLKAALGFGPADNLVFYEDGSVEDEDGNDLGSLYDEL